MIFTNGGIKMKDVCNGRYVEMISRKRILEGQYVSPQIKNMMQEVARRENDKELLTAITKA